MNAVFPPAEPVPARRGRRLLDAGLTALAVAVVVAFYGWTVDSGGGFAPVSEDDLYHLLVRGYRKGQLHLDRAPAPELLALADPYDPKQNGPHRLPDVTYYRGHYYLYFGATPALTLMLPYALLTGRDLSTGAAVFVFMLAGFLAASGGWLVLRRRYFPNSAWWTGALGVLVLGFGTHVLALGRRPLVWELPIAAGFAFAMFALLAVFAAVHGRRPLLALTVAGICVGLAMAARPPLLFGAALLVAPAWLVLRRTARPRRAWWRVGLAASAGLVVCGVLMLWHNHARFDSALEFGQNYQLTAAKELENRHFGLDYIWHNLRVYYLHAPQWSWNFPFVAASMPKWTVPGYAGSEEMCGLLVTFPFLAFALCAPVAWLRRPVEQARALRAMLVAIAGLFLGVGAFLLCFFSTTERYLAEFTPALALLALAGWLGMERWLQSVRFRALGMAMSGLAALATVPVGVLVSLNYHGNSLRRDNPALWTRLERTSHQALAQLGLRLGEFTGPRVLRVRFASRPTGTIETFWQSTDPQVNERVLVEHLGEHRLRFGYERGSELPARWGSAVTWRPNTSHTVEVQIPSLYGSPGSWMNGVRLALEFRERSSVVVWFDGERTLVAIVPLLPSSFVPGGELARGFGGEVRRQHTRLFRHDEVPLDVEGMSSGPGGGPPAGGTLRLRILLPDALQPAGEPLFAAGVLYGSDIVYVRDAEDGELQFVYECYSMPRVFGTPLRLDRNREHTVEITLPSFVPENFGATATGDIVVRVNGGEALRGRTVTFGFSYDSVRVGRNPFDTTCGPEFRGWLLGAEWTGRR